jgi:hypothetical protein
LTLYYSIGDRTGQKGRLGFLSGEIPHGHPDKLDDIFILKIGELTTYGL